MCCGTSSWTIRGGGHWFVVACQYTVCCSTSSWTIWGGGHRCVWDVSTLCAVVPPPGLYGVVGTGVLWHVSTLCALAPPPGLHGVVGTGVLRGSLWIRKWAPCSTSGPSIRQTEPSTILYGKVKVEISKVSLGCGRLSVGGEVTNRVTIKEPCYQRQCGAVGVDSSTWCKWC